MNRQKYNEAFMTTFGIDGAEVEGLEYQCIPVWDSVGHIELVAAIEDAFDIMMETDDIIDFNSYKKGIELLKKYNVEM